MFMVDEQYVWRNIYIYKCMCVFGNTKITFHINVFFMIMKYVMDFLKLVSYFLKQNISLNGLILVK